MGRHTRKPDHGSDEDADEVRSDRDRWLGKVPLLSAVTGVLAIGAIVSAVSTKQISLNFAGGTPPSMPPAAGNPASPHAKHGRGDAQGSRSAVLATFRIVALTATGFRAQVTLANRGSGTVSGWTLALQYPNSRVTSVSGAVLTHDGGTDVLHNPAARPSIAPGGTVKVAYVVTGKGRAHSLCLFNGAAC